MMLPLEFSSLRYLWYLGLGHADNRTGRLPFLRAAALYGRSHHVAAGAWAQSD